MSVIFLYPVICCSVVAVIKKHQSYLDKRFFNRMFVVLLVCGFHNSWQVHQTASSKNNPKNVYWTRYFCENTKKKSILWTARKAGTCKKARTKKKLLRTRFCSDYWKEIHFPQKDVYLKINIISKNSKSLSVTKNIPILLQYIDWLNYVILQYFNNVHGNKLIVGWVLSDWGI